MREIGCNIVKDLMPLYIDGVVSSETEEEIQRHIERCSDCQEEYRVLTQRLELHSSPNIQEENSKVLKVFKRKWKIKKIMIASISVFLTILLIFTGYMIYENVEPVHDYFSPMIMVSWKNEHVVNEWQRVQFDENEYLVFDSIFYSKEVINDANSSDAVILRISDTAGKIIIDNLFINPGEGAELNQLENGKEYIVQVKMNIGAEFVMLRFV